MWNHLTWPKCFECFWLYCRKKFTKNHMNPLSGKACSSLMKIKINRSVSKTTAFVFQPWWKISVLMILLLLISPLISLTVFPYTVYKNIVNKKKSKEEMNCFSKVWIYGWVFILCLLFLPISLLITILFYFYVVIKLKKNISSQ